METIICVFLVMFGTGQTKGRILSGQVLKPMTMTFMCNNTNTYSIRISKNHSFGYLDYIIYDVARKNCIYTNYSQSLNNRIESCVFNNTNFNLVLRELLWQDKGYYTAWDDQGLLLDSLFVVIKDINTASPPSTSTPDCHKDEHEYKYVDFFEGKVIWLLVSAVVNGLLFTCLAIIAVRKLRHRKGKKTKKELNCSDTDHSIFQATVFQSKYDDDDERKYEEPRSNEMELTAYVEPILQPVNVYERLHPYENQGKHMYRSVRPDTII